MIPKELAWLGKLRCQAMIVHSVKQKNRKKEYFKGSRKGFDREDQEQFAQLIGYSVCGFSDLSYASPDRVKNAAAKAEKLYG